MIIPRNPRINKAGEITRFSHNECNGSKIREIIPSPSALGYAVALRTKYVLMKSYRAPLTAKYIIHGATASAIPQRKIIALTKAFLKFFFAIQM